MKGIAAAVLCALIAAPSFAAISREDLKKALEANPDLVLSALKKADKAALFETVVDAQKDYQVKKEKEAEEQQKKELEGFIKDPMKPVIDDKALIRGDKNAPLTIVVYSDFECPFCARGFGVEEQLRQKYGSKLRFVFKDMPLTSIHHYAMPAAQWFEAVALQSRDKAWLFHDKMFQNQDKISDDFFRKTVKDLGVDFKKAEKDRESAAVKEKIQTDSDEGHGFGFGGTPGYLINGVPLRGAYPLKDFDAIISRLKI